LQGASGNLPIRDPMDTSQHLVEAWMDGVNANARLDGVLVSAPSAASIGSNLTAVSVGMAASGNYHLSSTSHAMHMIFSAKPSDAYIARLRAWCAAFWGSAP
jgi:hypothetical protein